MVREYLKEIGYTNYDIEKILTTYPICNLKEETLLKNIKKNYEYFIVIGYTQEEVLKMTKSFPVIYGLSIENIKQKIEDLESLGYSHEEVLKMTKIHSIIYGLSIENIKQKIEDLESLGYGHEEVLKMTKSLPSIYNFSIENIKNKIEYLKEIGLEDIIINDSKQLMQSVDLTYARYELLKEKGIDITIENYIKLFINNKRFEKQYGITKQEILEKYNYNEYINRNRKEI